jgi:hypothetical protein
MLSEYGHDRVEIAYTDPGSEHPDNLRFIADCERWFDHPVTILKSAKYADTWDVWEKRRFLVGATGALCTVELKKKLRYAFERPTDVQVFGYTAGEEHRAEQFRTQNPGVDLRTPLIERGLGRNDCLAIIDRAGIEIPAMYRLGYANANCQGCPKGGMGYWNKVRVDFPEIYERMAKLERDIGHSIQKDEHGPVWLDEMDPERGDYPTEPKVECSLLCALAEGDLDAA